MVGMGVVCLSVVAGVSVALAEPPVPSEAPQVTANGPYTPPACVSGVPFADITCTTGFDPWIEQFGLDGITAGCGGGNYCPGTPVTRDQMAVFIEKSMRGTANWPPHTQLVWAVKASDGSPDTVASGTALLNAVAAIPTSGNDVPSSTNPWLVKVGAGIFDLNGSVLNLPPYVNLDGAGQDTTTITSNVNYYMLHMGSGHNTLSNVTLMNSNSGTYTYGVEAYGTGLTLDHVVIEVFNGTTNTVGLYSYNSNVAIFDGAIITGGGSDYGIYTHGGQYQSSQVWRTLFNCNTYDVNNAAGQEIDLAYCRIPDSLHNAGTGVYHCIGNYNFSLVPVTCP
jgi:hypothetical protein